VQHCHGRRVWADSRSLVSLMVRDVVSHPALPLLLRRPCRPRPAQPARV